MRTDGCNEDENAMFIRSTQMLSGRMHVISMWGPPLPIKDRREELGNQALIIWPEGLGVNWIIALAVQVVWVERTRSSKGSLVLFVCEM